MNNLEIENIKEDEISNNENLDEDIDVSTVKIRFFDLDMLPMSCTCVMVASPGSGKTCLIENIMYYKKHLYPVARIFSGTEATNKSYSKFVPPLYISYKYDRKEEKKHIARQQTMVQELDDKKYIGNYAINVIDDCTDDPKIFKSPEIRALFKLGSQHYNQLFLLGTQYAVDLPPDIRKSISFVFLFREPELNERRKLYDNFGGLAGSFKNFCALMDGLTGDYRCMVINKRAQSNKLEDCIYYYKGDLLGKWQFGCKEYRDWAKQRYIPNFKPDLLGDDI